MKDLKPWDPAIKSRLLAKLSTAASRPIDLRQEKLVDVEFFSEGQSLPLVIKPAVKNLSLCIWAANNVDFIQESCLKHGAILFRNFDVSSAADFEQVIQSISGEVMQYQERSSPRSKVSGNVYTSTDYPADQRIFPHNEHSYALTFPLKLYFCCQVPAPEGGETPLADTRKILRLLSPKIRERFIQKQWMYVRNFGDGFGLPWQTVFQTEDKLMVEQYCKQARIECQWRDKNRLRTRQVRPAVAEHPKTGETVWFNHATFFHVSTLEPSVREALLAGFAEEDLPNNTYYGDGSSIEPDVLEALREAYMKECVTFRWEKGDVVMLDNMLTAHARRPFVGPRKVVFGMAEPFRRRDIQDGL